MHVRNLPEYVHVHKVTHKVTQNLVTMLLTQVFLFIFSFFFNQFYVLKFSHFQFEIYVNESARLCGWW